MCRFALYLGSPILISSLVTEPVNSIIHQSFHSHEREEPLNGDGFGLAWYVPDVSDQPAIFKDISPAWSNPNLISLARVTRSGCILAHVRAATPGLPVTQLNCHPFGWGPFAFMHNGHIAGFKAIVRRLQGGLSDDAFDRLQGSTDSELLFAIFSDHYRTDDGAPLERMGRGLLAAIAETERLRQERGIEETSQLNLALTDGRRAVVTRYASDGAEPNSLYLQQGGRYVCREGVCAMARPREDERALIVASERLSPEPGWQRVPANHMVMVEEDLGMELRPIGA